MVTLSLTARCGTITPTPTAWVNDLFRLDAEVTYSVLFAYIHIQFTQIYTEQATTTMI